VREKYPRSSASEGVNNTCAGPAPPRKPGQFPRADWFANSRPRSLRHRGFEVGARMSGRVMINRHGRACPGHPRLAGLFHVAGGYVYFFLTNRPNGNPLCGGDKRPCPPRSFEHRFPGFVDGFHQAVWIEAVGPISKNLMISAQPFQREHNIKHWSAPAWKGSNDCRHESKLGTISSKTIAK